MSDSDKTEDAGERGDELQPQQAAPDEALEDGENPEEQSLHAVSDAVSDAASDAVSDAMSDDAADGRPPGEDGLVLQDGPNRGTFLPSVWESLPEPADFLASLDEEVDLLRAETEQIESLLEVEKDRTKVGKKLDKADAAAAKAAVDNFTRWLAVHVSQEYSEAQIRVNAIAPGFFLTEQNRFLLTQEGTGELTPRGARIVDHTPMGRFGAPEDLVGTALWLLSGGAAFVHGIVVPVDGGFSAYGGV